MDVAARDRDIIVLCSDSRGSGAMTPFFERFPGQSVEVGIAEQNLVSIAAGMASCGKKCFAVSPASFLSTRSYEQIKVDVAYSGVNVKLIGISGGVSYGALGTTHHALSDIAALGAWPGMRVYLPSDGYAARSLIRALYTDNAPAYIRVGRGAVESTYDEDTVFDFSKPHVLRTGGAVALLSTGEMLPEALKAADLLRADGIGTGVIDLVAVKPLDMDALSVATGSARVVLTVEEHYLWGGLGALVSQYFARVRGPAVWSLGLPDENLIAGKQQEVLAYYGLDAAGIARTAMEALNHG